MFEKQLQPTLEAWIVTPDGDISNEIVTPTSNGGGVVEVSWEIKDRRPVGIRSWGVNREWRDLGYRTLEEMYENEGWAEGYEVYLDFVRQCRAKKIRKAIPSEYLPDSVLKRRKTSKDPEFKLPPSSKPTSVPGESKPTTKR